MERYIVFISFYLRKMEGLWNEREKPVDSGKQRAYHLPGRSVSKGRILGAIEEPSERQEGGK